MMQEVTFACISIREGDIKFGMQDHDRATRHGLANDILLAFLNITDISNRYFTNPFDTASALIKFNPFIT
jgi:hypothetical protein